MPSPGARIFGIFRESPRAKPTTLPQLLPAGAANCRRGPLKTSSRKSDTSDVDAFMPPPKIAKNFAQIFGVVLVVLSVFAFLPNPLFGEAGYFSANASHAAINMPLAPSSWVSPRRAKPPPPTALPHLPVVPPPRARGVQPDEQRLRRPDRNIRSSPLPSRRHLARCRPDAPDVRRRAPEHSVPPSNPRVGQNPRRCMMKGRKSPIGAINEGCSPSRRYG